MKITCIINCFLFSEVMSNQTKPSAQAVKSEVKQEIDFVKPSPVKETKPVVIQKIPPKGETNHSSSKTNRGFLTRSIYVAGHNLTSSELCPELGAGLRLLIVITSAPDHSAARMAVRQTWGHFGQRKDVSKPFNYSNLYFSILRTETTITRGGFLTRDLKHS